MFKKCGVILMDIIYYQVKKLFYPKVFCAHEPAVSNIPVWVIWVIGIGDMQVLMIYEYE